MSARTALFAAALLPAAALGQVSIGPNGIRAGGTVIDGGGVHTDGLDVTPGGVRSGRGGAAVVIRTNGNTRTIDCGGGALRVDGNANHLTVRNCREVTLNGNGNDVAADFAADGRVALLGNHNRLRYHAAPRTRVAIGNPGTGNGVSRY